MRRGRGPELTDDDLRRLARLGADLDQVAEAAGLSVTVVERRMARLRKVLLADTGREDAPLGLAVADLGGSKPRHVCPAR